MKFTVLSHAGLLVEHRGTRIVSDPWLLGSCYWRSWWNYPEPPPGIADSLEVDYIYLTHLHWDHFHGPSLRKLLARNPFVKVLVPKVPTRRMLEDLAYLGFEDVREIPHGATVQLGEDFTLSSFQFGAAVDSAMVLAGGGRVLLNANDCKHFGLPLRQITNRFPRFDFVFRSHSSASPIPYCVDGYTEAFPNLRSPRDYIEEFSRFALHVRARHAVPFASNHCFLHRDTYAFNATAVSPEDVRAYYTQLARSSGSDSECVVMTPGSSWSDESGFDVVPFDYAGRSAHIEALRDKHAGTLAAQYDLEAAARVDHDSADRYFAGFLRALPTLLRPRWRLTFRVSDAAGAHCWVLDFATATVRRADQPDPGGPVIDVPVTVFNDCVCVRMFSAWTASKRLRIRLRSPAELAVANGVFSLLDFYELDMMPLRRNFSLRSLGVRARRWRDAVEAVVLLTRHRLLGKPFDVASLYELPAADPGR
ncbi:MAG: MBL fold metallo-hydrolase [Pseudomonadota bacterium]